jgi:hypothetical protein
MFAPPTSKVNILIPIIVLGYTHDDACSVSVAWSTYRTAGTWRDGDGMEKTWCAIAETILHSGDFSALGNTHPDPEPRCATGDHS